MTVQAETRELSLPEPRDFLWQYVGSSTPLAAVVAGADEAARSALEREVVASWQECRAGDGMTCQQRIVIATARH